MHICGEDQILAVSPTAVVFLLLMEQQSWLWLHTKKYLKPTDQGVKSQAETVLRVQVAVRLKPAELTAVS